MLNLRVFGLKIILETRATCWVWTCDLWLNICGRRPQIHWFIPAIEGVSERYFLCISILSWEKSWNKSLHEKVNDAGSCSCNTRRLPLTSEWLPVLSAGYLMEVPRTAAAQRRSEPLPDGEDQYFFTNYCCNSLCIGSKCSHDFELWYQ